MISWPSMNLPPINLYTVPLLGNVKSSTVNQSMSKKVLFVCAQGRLRSATAMHLMHRMYGYNTRCCGTDKDALFQANERILGWADEICTMDEFQKFLIQGMCDDMGIAQKVRSLNIPDDYDYMDDELCSLIQRRYFA